ncbi:MAG: L-ascorbate 6-phosphate lactonase [Lactobacillaceae bacterium]
MSKIDETTEQTWKNQVFPEWGTWLNEEIDNTIVPKNKFMMWWLVNMGLWIKSDAQTNIAIDLWCGTGKTAHKLKEMSARHQWARLTGGRIIQPNLRSQPNVFNPFKIKKLDAFLVTHFHHDHIDLNAAAAVLKNTSAQTPFIGPKYVVQQWIDWGVPANRCITVKPGDTVKVKDITIQVTDSFDRSVLITDPDTKELPPDDVVPEMDERAVNFVINTSAGTIYDAADSHYCSYFAKHGQDFKIDVATVAYGENPIGVQDKMTSVDVLRTAEALQTKVIIPLHWDIWSNMLADPQEIEILWDLRKKRFNYQFYPFLWLPGGSFTYPDDRTKIEYYHDRGFADRYTYPVNLPYKSFL